jgi:hypothetical protein
MGGMLHPVSGMEVRFSVHVIHIPDCQIQIIEDGKPLSQENSPISGSQDEMKSFAIQSDGQRHWVRVEVHSADGKVLLVGNPIYINF